MTTLEPAIHQQPVRMMTGASHQNFVRTTPRTLEQAVHAAVCAIADHQLKPVTADEPAPRARTRALLALVTHCYARQLYSSLDLADIAGRDADFARLGGARFPAAGTLRDFRGENREVVHGCLVQALRFLAEQKISLGVLTKVSEAQLAEEASRRLIMAAFLDCVELDGAQVTEPPVEISYLFAKDPAHRH